MNWQGGVNNRPDWDTYFLTLAFITAQRSIDNSTVHGAVLVSKDNRILSTGYNGAIPGCNDKELPVEHKHAYTVHAEANAMLHCNVPQSELDGATLYITGEPCHNCLKTILTKACRLKRIVYGKVKSRMIEKDLKEQKAIEVIIKSTNTKSLFEELDIGENVLGLLSKTEEYVKERGF